MKNTYRVEMMTKEEYSAYMMGNMFCTVKTVEIEAETVEEAIAKAKAGYSNMFINKGYVKTVEEIEAERKAREEARAEAERKEAERKEKAKAREEAKAEAMGMTVEEYKEAKKIKAKKTRYNNEIKRMEAEIEKMKAEIERKRKWIENN